MGAVKQFAPEVPLELQPAAEAPDESDPGPRICPWCSSLDLIAVEYYGPSGVTSPDGGKEYQLQLGYKCLNCGGVEEA
jgi:hypothetical protein